MRRHTFVLLVVIGTTSLAGCYNHRLNVGAGAPKGRIVYEGWHSYYLFGAVGDPQINLAEFCPSGNATISRSVSAGNNLAAMLTLGFYSPMTITIKCASAAKHAKASNGAHKQ